MPKQRVSQDPRFHHEIWKGPGPEFVAQSPSISYVENHNADWDYALAADDFKLAADALIAVQKHEPNMGNWTAPVCHLIRQSIELKLKGLRQAIHWRIGEENETLAFTHDLCKLWGAGRHWLLTENYPIDEDVRLQSVDRLVENLDAIDPIGDLFRFGTSKVTAFGRPKTYDRVGYSQNLLFTEFDNAYACLSHWWAVVFRGMLKEQEGWDEDRIFDADGFPRV